MWPTLSWMYLQYLIASSRLLVMSRAYRLQQPCHEQQEHATVMSVLATQLVLAHQWC